MYVYCLQGVQSDLLLVRIRALQLGYPCYVGRFGSFVLLI